MRKLTFEDRKNGHKFWSERDQDGGLVLNNSDNYKDISPLVLDRSELEKIIQAQHFTYQYIVDQTLAENERGFTKQLSVSPFPKRTISLSIESSDAYSKQDWGIYNQVMIDKANNDIPYGARFLLPSHYKRLINNEYINGYLLQTVWQNIIGPDGNTLDVEFPSASQKKHITTAINIQWIARLQHLATSAR